ncbi:hypothetical protein MMC21_000743 [Puttea exsequens]|nr:hypothetical protein [Puttea exsequens]
MTNTVIVPVLHQQSIARIEKVSLIRQVKARDYVIGKLVERMQTDGLDLSRVFPGTASSKVGTGTNARKVIGKSIKGLTDFEQEEWQRTVFQDEKRPNMLMDLLSQLFNDSTEASSNVQAPDALDFGDWWKQLRGEDSQFKLADDSTSIRSEGGGSQGDDFQTQPTPPKDQERDQPPKESKARRDHVEGGMLLKQQSQDTDSTTDDTDDESSLSQHKKSLSMSDGRGKSTHSPESHRNKISDSKEQLIDRHNGVMNSPDRPTAARPKDEASSDSEDSMQLDHNRPPSNIATGTLVSGHYDLDKPKPKLGRIGGVGKIGMASTSQKLSNTPTTALSHKSFHGIDATHAKNDLRASTPPTISAKNHKQPALPPKAPLSPEETEQERANRKREQLKREIENKRQLGAKKKRKF